MNDQNTQAVNSKKLYVGNLSYDTTEDGLRDAFGQFGEIADVKLIVDKFSGRSKGFAFVEFTDEESAQKAVDAMNGKDLDGRQITVNVARPMAPRPAFGDRGPRRDFRGGGQGGYRGGRGGDRGGRGGYGGGQNSY